MDISQIIKKLLLNKKIVFIGLITLIVIGFVVFWLWREAVFSKEILKLEILGPGSAMVGEEVTYAVKYKNNGSFILENPRLIFELPKNSLTEDSKTRFTEDLKDIYPGEERVVEFKGRLLGKEQDLKVAHAWLNYVPRNLSARYESETTLTTKIESVPITLTYDASSRIETGKEIVYSINYFSNVEYPLENLSIRVDRTDGFEIKSSDPISLDNSEWKLDTLTKGKGGKIIIRGIATVDTGNRLTLSAKLGMWQDGVFIVIKEVNQDVEIVQPLLSISQQVNGDSNYIASPGETLNYQIALKNTSSSPFSELIVLAKLEGQSFDMSTLQSIEGEVTSGSNLIVFDPNKISKLKKLYPKQEIQLNFQVKLKNTLDTSRNLSVKSIVDVLDVNHELVTKINSKVDFWQKVYRTTTNGIENFGPIPPKVGQDTSYTVVWEVKNQQNSLKNIRIKAILPQNVSLVDNIYPENEASHFSFDSSSREIIWSAGNIAPEESTQLTFQVVLKPSSYQAGNTAQIIGQATIFADDQFTGATIQKTVSGVTTSLPDDSANSGGGIIQP